MGSVTNDNWNADVLGTSLKPKISLVESKPNPTQPMDGRNHLWLVLQMNSIRWADSNRRREQLPNLVGRHLDRSSSSSNSSAISNKLCIWRDDFSEHQTQHAHAQSVLSRTKVEVKVPGLTTPYSNEDCRRRGRWVWTTCPESLRSYAPTGIEPVTSRSKVRRPTVVPPRHPVTDEGHFTTFIYASTPQRDVPVYAFSVKKTDHITPSCH